jgi:hypothetical protein
MKLQFCTRSADIYYYAFSNRIFRDFGSPTVKGKESYPCAACIFNLWNRRRCGQLQAPATLPQKKEPLISIK